MSPEVEQASKQFMQVAERLPTLYHLSDDYLHLLDLLEDPETDPEAIEAELVRVAGDIKKKAYGLAVVVRQLEGLSELQKAEGQRLANKAKASQANADRLRDYAKRCMDALNLERLELGTFTLSVKQNPPRVEVLEAAMVPSEYQRTKVIIDVDKRAVTEHWKATGEVVPGTEIVRAERLDIR